MVDDPLADNTQALFSNNDIANLLSPAQPTVGGSIDEDVNWDLEFYRNPMDTKVGQVI